MEEINTKIENYLALFRDINKNYQEIINILNPSDEVIKHTIEQLLMSSNEGILDYKESIFNPLFTFINSLKNSPPQTELFTDQINSVLGALIVIFIQKLYTIRKIDISDKNNNKDDENQEEESFKKFEDIITEINKSIVIDKNINNKYIKNILNYIKELNEIKKSFLILASCLKASNKEAYVKNFLRISNKIKNMVEENYKEFSRINKNSANMGSKILLTVPMRKLTPILNVQIESLIKIYITMDFALKQNVGINKILFPLIMENRNIKLLLEKEEITYKSFFLKTIEDKAERKNKFKQINKVFCNEILYCIKETKVKKHDT